MFRKALNVILLSTALVTVVACNTVRGAGDDLQSAANEVDEET